MTKWYMEVVKKREVELKNINVPFSHLPHETKLILVNEHNGLSGNSSNLQYLCLRGFEGIPNFQSFPPCYSGDSIETIRKLTPCECSGRLPDFEYVIRLNPCWDMVEKKMKLI